MPSNAATRTANRYAERAEDYFGAYQNVDRQITDYVNKKRVELGGSTSALVSQQLQNDIPLMDAISDRNRYIQLTIMYSNLSLMHKLLNYGNGD